MPKTDHAIRQGFECVVQLSSALESDQGATKIVFPPENMNHGVETLSENLRFEYGFAPALRSFSSAWIGVYFRGRLTKNEIQVR
jgi:hypothetical protein